MSTAAHPAAALGCLRCGLPLPDEAWTAPEGIPCPACGARLMVRVFPALLRPVTAAVPERLQEEGEASCFFHPQSRAAVACDQCGRFLCPLCELDLGGRRVCPSCLRAGTTSGSMTTLERSRVLRDSLALLLATLPAVIVWPSLLCAPTALYLTVRHWRRPQSLLPRTRVRFVLASLLAVAQLGGWVALIYLLASSLGRLRSSPT